MRGRCAWLVLMIGSACGSTGASGESGSTTTSGQSGSGEEGTTGAAESSTGSTTTLGTTDDGPSDSSSDESGGVPKTCPPPLVFCPDPPPECSEGTFPAADPCFDGYCPDRCWTGECETCASECGDDDECVLVGRHGCCDSSAGDCLGGCFWAEHADVVAGDPCYFVGPCPLPAPPDGCPQACDDKVVCEECPHCGPDAARCEGGACVSAWTDCEPLCGCD